MRMWEPTTPRLRHLMGVSEQRSLLPSCSAALTCVVPVCPSTDKEPAAPFFVCNALFSSCLRFGIVLCFMFCSFCGVPQCSANCCFCMCCELCLLSAVLFLTILCLFALTARFLMCFIVCGFSQCSERWLHFRIVASCSSIVYGCLMLLS